MLSSNTKSPAFTQITENSIWVTEWSSSEKDYWWTEGADFCCHYCLNKGHTTTYCDIKQQLLRTRIWVNYMGWMRGHASCRWQSSGYVMPTEGNRGYLYQCDVKSHQLLQAASAWLWWNFFFFLKSSFKKNNRLCNEPLFYLTFITTSHKL